MKNRELAVGEIVQLSPDARNPMFACCYMTVTEPKAFGAQGFVQMLGKDEKIGGAAFYRATFEEMEPTGGFAVWVLE